MFSACALGRGSCASLGLPHQLLPALSTLKRQVKYFFVPNKIECLASSVQHNGASLAKTQMIINCLAELGCDA